MRCVLTPDLAFTWFRLDSSVPGGVCEGSVNIKKTGMINLVQKEGRPYVIAIPTMPTKDDLDKPTTHLFSCYTMQQAQDWVNLLRHAQTIAPSVDRVPPSPGYGCTVL